MFACTCLISCVFFTFSFDVSPAVTGKKSHKLWIFHLPLPAVQESNRILIYWDFKGVILKEWGGRKGVRLFRFMPSTRKVSSKPTQKPCVKPFTVLISTVNYKLSYLSSSLDTTVGQVVQLLLVKPCNLLFWNSFLGRFCVWQRYTLCLDKRIFSKKAAAIVIWHVLNNVLL